MQRAACLTGMVLACSPLVVLAQAEDLREEETELEFKLQNPITDLLLVQLLSTVDLVLGETEENRTTVSAQAQLPIRVTGRWNVLSWTQLPIQSLPPAGPSGERVNGIGDTTQYLLLEPAKVLHVLWGVGPVALLLPTATKSVLGSGQFGLGPAGFVSYQDDWWTVGLLAHHLRSVDGAVAWTDVERTFFKPFLSYTFQSGVAVGLESEATLDWNHPVGGRWTVRYRPARAR